MPSMPGIRRGGSKGKLPGPVPPGGGVATLDGPPPGQDLPPGARSRRRYDPAWDEWKRPRRWPGVVITCVIVLGFLSAVVWHYRPRHTEAPRPTFTSRVHPSASFVPATTGGASVVSFSGKKNAANLQFTASGGLTVLHAQCACTYNFVVTINDTFGGVVAVPVSVGGFYNGTSTLTLAPGRYSMSVVGEPKWSVEVIQPTPRVPAIATPFRYFSTGSSVLGPFSSANQYLAYRFFQTAPGGTVVSILDLRGTEVQTPFKGIGLYRGETTLQGLPNPYYVKVTASGYWNLTVRRTAPAG
jgi:hypothetical protein